MYNGAVWPITGAGGQEERILSVTVDTQSAEITDRANRELAERLRDIPGIRFTSRTSPPLCHPVVEVRLLDENPEVETAVYRAEMEVHQRFPSARIEVQIL